MKTCLPFLLAASAIASFGHILPEESLQAYAEMPKTLADETRPEAARQKRIRRAAKKTGGSR